MKFFLAAVLLLPFVFAFDCDLTSDESFCSEVVNSDFNESEKDALFSSLLYSDTDLPNHDFVEDYNLDIEVNSPPDDTRVVNSKQIRNAWLSFLAVFPSVYEEGSLFIPSDSNVLSEYDYSVYVPPDYSGSYPRTSNGDCKRTYQLVQNKASLKYYFNSIYKGAEKFTSINLNSNGTLKAQLNINTRLKVRHYHWRTYCCRWDDGGCTDYCHSCDYRRTSYEPDSVTLSEEKQVKHYKEVPSADLIITDQYLDTTKGRFTAKDYSFFKLSFEDSYVEKMNYYYDLVFDKKPYYFAYLRANYQPRLKQKNIFLANDTFFVKNTDSCLLSAYNHFNSIEKDCDLTLHQENLTALHKEETNADFSLLFYTLVFCLVVYVIYRLANLQLREYL